MPDLPTIGLASPAAYQQLLDAFGGEEAYLDWLRRSIRDEVVSQASRLVIQNAQVEADSRAAEARAMLDGAFA